MTLRRPFQSQRLQMSSGKVANSVFGPAPYFR